MLVSKSSRSSPDIFSKTEEGRITDTAEMHFIAGGVSEVITAFAVTEPSLQMASSCASIAASLFTSDDFVPGAWPAFETEWFD